ncbi:oxidoreductase [Nocardiopsis sp. CNT312]|uniref:oxidoreductase n=1 Tax=Nocardiopsis sp. CNT312 TaxID=1137268 RepID=UPI000491BCE4|nr:oxidoreductase [Nocardiopsis sp. CNT312]
MLHTLIVGLGRSGEGLHLPSLAKARDREPTLFAPGPVLGFDPFLPPVDGVLAVGSLAEAADRARPEDTVVHLCTPPHVRSGLLAALAETGYRRVIVEKPLALDLVGLAEIARVRRSRGLDITVSTQWLDSALTRRLRSAVRSGPFGRLRSVTIVQNKPRFTRTARVPGHPTAFDVEVPHALAVAIALAGPADVARAELEDMVTERTRQPGMGRARLDLRHHAGVRTRIDSDLTSPVRERRITLRFDGAELIGHYPCSAADHTAQLRVEVPGRKTFHSVFDDDALTAFLVSAYTRYADPSPPVGDLPGQVEAVRLLVEAKRLCAPAPAPAAQEVARAVGA